MTKYLDSAPFSVALGSKLYCQNYDQTFGAKPPKEEQPAPPAAEEQTPTSEEPKKDNA